MEDVERSRNRELSTLDPAALAVVRRADQTFPQDRRIARSDRIAGEVEDLVAVIDVAFQVLVIASQRDIAAAVGEVFLDRDVSHVSDEGHQVRVAATARPGRTVDVARICQRSIIGVVARGAHVVHPRPRQGAGQAQADEDVLARFQDEVGAGQDLQVVDAARDRQGCRDAGCDLTCREAAGLLVRMDCLDADITRQRQAAQVVIDIGADIGGGDLFRNFPVACHHVGIGIANEVQGTAFNQGQGVIADDLRNPQVAQVGRLQQELGRNGQINTARRAQVILVVDKGLVTLRHIDAEVEGAEWRLAQFATGRQADGLDLILDRGRVHIANLAFRDDVTAPSLRAGQLDQVGVGIVQLAGEAGHAIGRQLEAQGIHHAVDVAARPGVGFQDDVIPLDLGVVQVQVERPVVIGDEPGVPAQGRDVAVALVQVVADHALDVVPGAGNDHAVFDRIAGTQRRTGTADVRGRDIANRFTVTGRTAPGERELDAAQDLGVLELRVEGVQRGVEAVVRLPFQHPHVTVAFQLGRHDVGLDPANHQVAIRVVRIAPRVEAFRLIGRRHVGIAQRDADGIVRELIDVAEGIAATMIGRASVQGPDVVPLIAGIHRNGLTTVIKGTKRPHVDGASQTLTDQSAIGGLVDHDAAKQFRGELVELDAAVVTRGDQLATVQQGGGEVRTQTPD